MILIIGGEGAGKRSYVRSLGFSDADMADAVIDGRSVVYNAQDMVLAEPSRANELIEKLSEKAVVICNEVGSGLIPQEAKKREARVAVGRLCCVLAQRADKVVRVVCGLPQRIK